ncbi:glycosyltransferase family 2 protein [Anaerosinus massiliensis]|uniref:glycosyltransferase family 2 protein n=1 Tax=Massilibacillus massiliensis TaxID=1806837 RepID=UPI000DA61D1F|nr:glycosyltransferase family 2 protein [Massilibacillus massiliensis]
MNSKKILVSIIVPVYKVERYVGRCIESILKQTLRDFELILIDDGSPDKSGEICEKYKMLDDRIKVFHQENKGPMAACKYGIDMAQGQYIGFVDSDDWVESEMYEHMYKTVIEDNADIVSCGVLYHGEKKIIRQYVVKEKSVFLEPEIEKYIIPNLLNYWMYEYGIYGPYRVNKLYRASIIKNNLEYCDERIRISEDMNLVLACTLDAKKMIFLTSCFYHYEWNQTSTSVSYTPNYFENNLILYKAFHDMVKEKNKKIHEEIDLYYNSMLIAAIRNLAKAPISLTNKCIMLKKYCENNPAKDLFRYHNYKNILKSYIIIFCINRKWYWILTFYIMKREFRKKVKELIVK